MSNASASILAKPRSLAEIVSQIEEDRSHVVLVGHNPGMEDLLRQVTGVVEHLPTAALAKIVLGVEKWHEVSEGKRGRLEWLVKPKELAAT